MFYVTMIVYETSIGKITPRQLAGFFVGWPNPPSTERHLDILRNASYVVLAVDTKSSRVIGFISAISDGVLTAYIPLLEVLPDYQKKGIGGELVQRMLEQLRGLYMIDLICDEPLRHFYEKYGMRGSFAMTIRDYARQSC